ncbi:MAG: 2,3,4,5-tetrahydropyridine-2,6-dicarboxylate N-succinyltransferase, partial [Aestuariivirgaceae bacterium]|nr:2,3,4,5-tetrahydropyridine-2,6-dicarboxylate N-succinyltransferase [Aestuariivirgaceae bacterium]
MKTAELEKTINEAWELRDKVSFKTRGKVRKAVETALALLDSGEARVAEKNKKGDWVVNQWLK